MTADAWHYSEELLRLLADHGIVPRPSTPPRLVREFLNDMYRYEIRRLRNRHVAGEVAKPDYVPKVIELRKKYVALTLTPDEWERACSK